jgi:hypothetical protein
LNRGFKKKTATQWLEFPHQSTGRFRFLYFSQTLLFFHRQEGWKRKRKKHPKQLLQASSVKYPEHWATRLESQIRAQRQGEFMGNAIITQITSSFFKT